MWSRRAALALLAGLAACAAPRSDAEQVATLAFGVVVEDGAGAAREWPHWDAEGRWSVPEGFRWRLADPLLECTVVAVEPARDARGTPCVHVRLTPADAARLGALSARALGQRLAVLVDGRVVCAPRLQSILEAEVIELSANFTQPEADALLARLRSAN